MSSNSIPIIINYVPGNPSHRDAFGALNREWITRYHSIEPQDEAMFADPEGIILHTGGAILMAEYNGKLVGTGGLKFMQPGVYEIIRMAVHEPHQGKGIGTMLLRSLLQRAQEYNATKLFIVSNTKLAAAIALYRAHGFTDSSEIITSIMHAAISRWNSRYSLFKLDE